MMIEAEVPLKVHIREQNVDVDLEPGQPVEFPDDQAKRIVAKAHGLVRVVTPQTADQEPTLEDWVTWRDADGRLGMGVVTEPMSGMGYYVVGENGDVSDIVAVHKTLIIR